MTTFKLTKKTLLYFWAANHTLYIQKKLRIFNVVWSFFIDFMVVFIVSLSLIKSKGSQKWLIHSFGGLCEFLSSWTLYLNFKGLFVKLQKFRLFRRFSNWVCVISFWIKTLHAIFPFLICRLIFSYLIVLVHIGDRKSVV